MKYLYWIIAVLIVVGGSWFWYTHQSPVSPAPEAPGPSQAAGINGSPNQGNLGQPDNGQVQQPLADGAEGSIIGANLALGTDGTAALGTYLIGYTGNPVYTYDKDTNTSTCYGACATNWPPYLVGPEDNINQLKSGVVGTHRDDHPHRWLAPAHLRWPSALLLRGRYRIQQSDGRRQGRRLARGKTVNAFQATDPVQPEPPRAVLMPV